MLICLLRFKWFFTIFLSTPTIYTANTHQNNSLPFFIHLSVFFIPFFVCLVFLGFFLLFAFVRFSKTTTSEIIKDKLKDAVGREKEK